MYADYEYYSTEYGGKMSADDYKRFGRRAERRIDGITGINCNLPFRPMSEILRRSRIAFVNWQIFSIRLTATMPPQWKAWERWRRLTEQ